MGLREDAIAAAAAAQAAAEAVAETARQARITGARAALAQVLSPASVDGMEVVDELTAAVVFCADDLCLMVRDSDSRVTLVTGTPETGWTGNSSTPVTSLAQLGLLIAAG